MGSQRPIDELPEYSSDLAPGYTPQPVLGEERLQISGRLNTNREEAAELFLVERKLITLTLKEKPIYARGARIEGQVALKKAEGVASVIIKLNGAFNISFGLSAKGRNTRCVSILDQEITLYKSRHQPRRFKWKPFSEKRVSDSAAIDITSAVFPEQCPSTLPFAINLPTGDLPPTYMAINGDEVSELKVDIQYSLEVIATSHGLVEHKHKVFVPIQYRPRSCPAAESNPLLSFAPHQCPLDDDWSVFKIDLPNRNHNADLPTISGKIYLPRTRVYAVTDSIPFCLRLSSVSKNLLKPFESITSLQDIAGGGSKRLQSSRPIERSGATVTLSIERHVSFKVKGSSFQFKEILSKVQSSPSTAVEGSATDMDLTHIEWKGHLKVQDRSRCGGFSATELGFNVKDFICLTIKPPNDQFRGIHYLIPVRLTTDPFVEQSLPGMEYVLDLAEELPRVDLI